MMTRKQLPWVIGACIVGWMMMYLVVIPGVFGGKFGSPESTASAQAVERQAEPEQEQPRLSAPAGVVVSGEYADRLEIRSIKAERDALGDFEVKLRIRNVSGEDQSWIGVKVTALRGEEVVATADGAIESIAAGQTITTEPFSADDFPSKSTGLTYEVELGS